MLGGLLLGRPLGGLFPGGLFPCGLDPGLGGAPEGGAFLVGVSFLKIPLGIFQPFLSRVSINLGIKPEARKSPTILPLISISFCSKVNIF